MNTAETIQAAIDKLDRLRVESTQPTGGTSWVQGNDKKPFESYGEIYTGPLSDESRDVASWVVPADAELIVTLHRTIDAQLAILRGAIGGARDMDEFAVPDEPQATRDAVLLGIAVLGEVSPDA